MHDVVKCANEPTMRKVKGVYGKKHHRSLDTHARNSKKHLRKP